MHIEYITEFKDTPPTPELILQKIRENTGLYVLMDVSVSKESDTIFLSHSSEKYGLPYLIDGNQVVIMLGLSKMFYLLGATLGALEDLGGTCDWDIPPWTRQKWPGKTFLQLMGARIPYLNLNTMTFQGNLS
jgi:hypothetical protein